MDEVSRIDATRLRALEYHWGDAYRIWHTGARWMALFRDMPSPPLSAATDGELRERIRADYAQRTGQQKRG